MVIEKEVFICQLTKKKKTGQGLGFFSQKKCKEGIYTPLDHRAINLLIYLTRR